MVKLSKNSKVIIEFELLDKEITIEGQVHSVYGLGSFDISPERQGLGTHIIRWTEEIAEKHNKLCVIAFSLPAKVDFYNNCGWYKCGTYDGRLIMASKHIIGITVNERW